MIFNTLTIAGSDSGGGAGIQADLKAMSARGVFGASVVTALTAQNTQAVTAIHAVPADFVQAQLKAVLSDIELHAVKVGMLFDPEVIEVVANHLSKFQGPIVVDPVMVAKSGDRLLKPEALDALRTRLIPTATVITPNLPEGADLLQTKEPTEDAGFGELAEALRTLKAPWVLLKGGHRSQKSESTDVLVGPDTRHELRGPRFETKNTHGTGCTLSSALAAELAKGKSVPEAAKAAKSYIEECISNSGKLKVGQGKGPVHHFSQWWSS